MISENEENVDILVGTCSSLLNLFKLVLFIIVAHVCDYQAFTCIIILNKLLNFGSFQNRCSVAHLCNKYYIT